MSHPLAVVTASDNDTPDDDVVTPVSNDVVVASDTRTISGRVLPWASSGNTSAGELKFTPSALRVPKDLSRVKLLRDHSPNGVPVGVMTDFENRPDGLYATFSIAPTPDGDRALAEASSKTRDSFSVEVGGLARKGTTVTDSVLRGVALVPFPAFSEAIVDTVVASDHTPDPTPEPNDDPETPDPNVDDVDNPDEDEDKMNPKKSVTPATVPGGLGTGTGTATDEPVTAATAAEVILGTRLGRTVDEAHAALVDITNSGTLDAFAPEWLGSLWSGVQYQRQVIPKFQRKALHGMKAHGYRWSRKPAVAKYAGDKTEIPSFPVELEPVEREAQRWAGGNDIDRKFLDFGDSQFLAEYWEAMRESYAENTDADFAEFLVGNSIADMDTQPDMIRAVTAGALKIQTQLKSPATAVLVNPDDLLSLLDFTELDTPKFMQLTAVSDPKTWVPTEFVPSGQILVGHSSAATFYELPRSPLRVQAEHIARGGFDAALFGYTSALLNKPEGLRTMSFGEIAAPGQ